MTTVKDMEYNNGAMDPLMKASGLKIKDTVMVP
jgi:hypothetical protein